MSESTRRSLPINIFENDVGQEIYERQIERIYQSNLEHTPAFFEPSNGQKFIGNRLI
jgi:hypothetical protein